MRTAAPETIEVAEEVINAAKRLRDAVAKLHFAAPVTHVYNPLDYAWSAHEAYLRRYANTKKRMVFLGMNPGPFGMAQTGVPFGEIKAVRDWLGIHADVRQPKIFMLSDRSKVSIARARKSAASGSGNFSPIDSARPRDFSRRTLS